MKLLKRLSMSLLLCLAACASWDAGNPSIALYAPFRGNDAIRIEGKGWEPNKTVKIWAYGEPALIDGEIMSSPAPRLANTFTPGEDGAFGVYPEAFFPITKYCGPLPDYIKPWVLAAQENGPRKKIYSREQLANFYAKPC